MQGDGHDEEKNMVQGGVVLVLLWVETCNGVEVRGYEIEDVEEQGSRHYSCCHQPPLIRLLKCGYYQSDGGCGKHYPCAVSEYRVVPLVRQFLYEESKDCTYDRCAT